MKKVVSVLLFVFLVFSLCACTVQPQEKKQDDTESKDNSLFKGLSQEDYNLASFPTQVDKTFSIIESFDNIDLSPVRIEVENFEATTMTTEEVVNDEFSGGKLLSCIGDQDEEGEYTLTYTVNIPETMPYIVTMVASCADNLNTTDFYIYVDGEKTFRVTDADHVEKAEATSLGSTKAKYIYLLDFGSYDFEKGEHEFKIVLKSSDTNIKNTYHFYGDYMLLSPIEDLLIKGGIVYSEEPTGEYAEQIEASGRLNVFTTKYSVKATIEATCYSESAVADYTVTVTDYDKQVVYSETYRPSVGVTSFDVEFGKLPLGAYTLDVKKGDETVFSQMFDVIIDPSEREILDDSPFAMMIGTGEDDWYSSNGLYEDYHTIYEMCSVAKISGVTWLRAGCNWKWFNEDKDEYDFTEMDAQAEQFKKAGINILRWINGQPSWAINNTFEKRQKRIYDVMKTLTERYEGVVKTWEIWNEQDYFEAESADLFSSFCKAAMLGVKDANTDTSVIFGALCQSPKTNLSLRTYAANGIMDMTDAFNYHYHIYDRTHASVTEFVDGSVAEEFSKYVAENNLTVPTWVTEAGILLYGSGKMSATQQKMQARYRVTSAVQSIASGTDKQFWFILSPGEEDGGNFGTFTSDCQPYPLLVSESVMTTVLGVGSYVGEVNYLSDDAEAHVMNNGTDDVIVLWSYSTEDVKIYTGSTVLLTTLMGKQTIVVPDEDGYITVTASPDPVYIQFDGKAPTEGLYTPSTLPDVKSIEHNNEATVGEHVVLTQVYEGTSQEDARASGYQISANGTEMTLKVLNLNETAVTGTVSVTVDGYRVEGLDIEITVEPQQTVDIPCTVYAESDAGVTFMTITGTFNGSETTPSAAQVHP